jgi:hypothetical protein
MVFAPSRVNSYARASPMPDEAPVIQTTLFSNFMAKKLQGASYKFPLIYIQNKLELSGKK